MSYTLKNLEDVEDSAPKFGFGEIGEAHFAHAELDAEQTGFAFHRLKPGMRQRFAHTHDDAEEVYVVIGGSGRVKLDDDVVEVRRLDALRIAPAVKRAVEAGDEGLEFLAFGPRHEGDGDLDFDAAFWGD